MTSRALPHSAYEPPISRIDEATRRRGRLRVAYLAAALTGVLAAFALRLILLDAFPLRDDEALYSTWALAAQSDPLFLRTFPDKPPIFLWLQAPALWLFGATAAGARLLSLAASTLTVALALPVARRVWPRTDLRGPAGVVALWLAALSPFAVSFAATAYTDSLLLFWFVLAGALGLRGRWWAAGAALGAAIFTKQQGLLFVPFILLLPWAAERERGEWARDLPQVLGGLALVVVPLMLWDASRWATAPSPWDLGVRNYGALGLAAPAAWGARARAWAEPFQALAATPTAWLLLGGALAAGVPMALRTRNRTAGLLYGWLAGFLLLHLASTLQPWDRYLLPAAPVMAVLAAGPLACGVRRLSARGALWGGAGVLLLLLLFVPPALTAARGGLPVGGDHGAFAGLGETTARLQQLSAEAAAAGQPAPAVYQQRLGRQFGYALAAEQEAGTLQVRWFASPTALADDAAKSPHRLRLLADPAWAPVPSLLPALHARGLELERQQQAGNVALYRIVEGEAARRACDWCLCSEAAPWRRIVAAPQWTPAQEASAGTTP